ncbi:hypothetical protein ES703_123189 [subsurface metagenome]
MGEVGLGLVVAEGPVHATQAGLRVVGGRSVADAGGLGQDADAVVPQGCLGHGALEEGVEDGAGDDAGKAAVSEVGYHVVAQHVDGGGEAGVDVGVDGVLVRGHEEAGAVGAHLVLVVDDLRKPVVIEHSGHQAGFGQVEEEPVAVVVVAGVVVIQPRERGPFAFGALGFVVIVRDHLLAVRVH